MFVVGMGYLLLLDRLRVILSERHPDIFEQLLQRSQARLWSPMASEIAQFMGKSQHRDLGDRQLTQLVHLTRVVFGTFMVLWCLWMVYLLFSGH